MAGRLLLALAALQEAQAVVVDLLTLPRPDNCSLLLDRLEDVLATSVTPLDQEEGALWRVEVRVPRGWDFSTCGTGRVATYRQPVQRPHIRVVEGGGPAYSLQQGGCGRRGLAVVLPLGLLRRPPVEVKEEVSKQWQRYLHGQFSSRGYPGDPMFPEDAEIRVEGNHSRPRSSKQELLCGGQPTIEGDVGAASPRAPIFMYSLPGRTTTQYLLVLDQSAQMASRWSHTRRSLHQFIDLLPAGSLLSVVTAGYRAREVRRQKLIRF